MRLSATHLSFALPEAACNVAFVSRNFVPAQVHAEDFDTRELGLCVTRLEINGEALALDRALGEGWRKAEGAHRWTDGVAHLPAGARIVIVDLGGEGNYWPAAEQLLFALA